MASRKEETKKIQCKVRKVLKAASIQADTVGENDNHYHNVIYL